MSAFPLVTRRPEASAARNTASVWRTVPMSRIAVVPPARSSARPSRAETSSVASSQRRLARPDVRPQPREERQVVRAVPEQRLAEMDVRLDESRQEPEAARVQALERASRGPDLTRAALRVAVESRDHAVLDEHVPAGRHVRRAGHPDDERVLDEKGSHRRIIGFLCPDLPMPGSPLRARAASAFGESLRHSPRAFRPRR